MSGRGRLCCILMATLEFQPPMTLSHCKLAFEYVKEVVGTVELRLIKKVTPSRDPRILRSGLMNLGCQIEEPTNQQNYQGVPDIQLGIQFRNFTLSVLRWTPGTSALW